MKQILNYFFFGSCHHVSNLFRSLIYFSCISSYITLFGQWPHPMEHIPLAKFSGWSGLQNWSGNFVKIALEQRNWCKVDPNTSPLPTEASRQYSQRINDTTRDEWFYLKSIFLKVFCVKWATLSDVDPDTGQTGHTEVEAGPGWQRLPWSHQLGPLGVSELRLDKSSFQWVLSILRCRERGSNFNFYW